jgi:hypothetical protein
MKTDDDSEEAEKPPGKSDENEGNESTGDRPGCRTRSYVAERES